MPETNEVIDAIFVGDWDVEISQNIVVRAVDDYNIQTDNTIVGAICSIHFQNGRVSVMRRIVAVESTWSKDDKDTLIGHLADMLKAEIRAKYETKGED